MSDDHDPIAELERLDRFFDGDEEGERPIDVLRNNGVSIPDERNLNDATLHTRLWDLINAMAAACVFDRDRLLPVQDFTVDEEIQ